MATMKGRAHATIARPAADIWALIGKFDDISWIPGSEAAKATMDGDIRSVTRDGWDFSLVQKLTEHDDTRFTYSYVVPYELSFEALIGPGKFARTIDGTLTVTPTGPDTSDLTWDLEAEDFLFPGAMKEYQLALDTVKAKLEA